MDENTFRRELQEQGYDDPHVVEWEPYEFHRSHWHDFAVPGFVLFGDFTLTTENGSTSYQRGDTFLIEAGVPHSETAGSKGVRFLSGRKATG